MHRLLKIVFLSVFISLIGFQFNGYAAQKVTIAVMDFDVVNQASLPKEINQLIPEWLNAYLVKSNRFVVLERTKLHQILKEKNLEQMSVFDPRKISEYPSLIGAESIIYGSVIHKGQQSDSIYSKLFSDHETGKIEITVKIVDLKTGEIVFADSVFTDDEAKLEECVERLSNKIIAKIPIRGFVVDITNRDLIIDMGENDGVHEGDILAVTSSGRKIKHPITNEEIILPDIQLAEFQIQEVYNRTAKGKLLLNKNAENTQIKPGFMVQTTQFKTNTLSKNLKKFAALESSTTGMGYVGLATNKGGVVDINPAGLPQISNSELSLEWKYNYGKTTITQQTQNTGAYNYGSFRTNTVFPHSMNFAVLFDSGLAMGINLHTDTIDTNPNNAYSLSNGKFNITCSIARAFSPNFMAGISLSKNDYWHTYKTLSNSDKYEAKGGYLSTKFGLLFRPNSLLRIGVILDLPLDAGGTYDIAGISGTYKEKQTTSWGIGLMYFPAESTSLGLDLLARSRPDVTTFYETHMGIGWDIGLCTITAGSYYTINYIPSLLTGATVSSDYSLIRQFYTLGVAKKIDTMFIELAIEKGQLTDAALIRPDISSGKPNQAYLNSLDEVKAILKIGTGF